MNYRFMTLFPTVCILCFTLTACKNAVPVNTETTAAHETIAITDVTEDNTVTSSEATETEPTTTVFPEFPQVDYELPEIELDATEPAETQGIPVPIETQSGIVPPVSETLPETTASTEILPTTTEPVEEIAPTESSSLETPEQEV